MLNDDSRLMLPREVMQGLDQPQEIHVESKSRNETRINRDFL